MNKQETAVSKFKEGFNCAQSVLFSLLDEAGISGDFALKAASGFGGGMGRTQNVCGAVSGGILALNLLYGRGEKDDKQKQEDLYLKVQFLIEEFEKKYHSVICNNLLDGCRLRTPEGQERFRSENMIEKCHDYVAQVVEILEHILTTV